jgi:peroxiredoxin
LPLAVLDAPDPAPVARALGEPKWDGTLPATFVFDARGKKVAAFLGTTTRAQIEKALRKARAAQ